MEKSSKNLVIAGLIGVIVIGVFLFLKGVTVTPTRDITRKDELILEGLINDYFYRRQIKDPEPFGKFDAYGSIVGESIVVYVYPKNGVAADFYWPSWKQEIEEGLHETLLDFEDFNWATNYSFDVVLRK